MRWAPLTAKQGREQEAIRTARQAVALAPNNENAWQMLGYAYYYAGLNELGEQAYNRLTEMNPTLLQPHWMHARMLLYSGKHSKRNRKCGSSSGKIRTNSKRWPTSAECSTTKASSTKPSTSLNRSLQLAGNTSDSTAQMMAGFLYASQNQRQKIDPTLLRYRPDQITDGDGAYWIGGIHALLGEKQLALAWLKRTVAQGDLNYPWFERDKNYDSLRSDPEYQAIMADVRQRWQAYKNEFDAAQ